MAKLFARVNSERGKVVGTSGNEYLDIDITIGNTIIESLTLRPAAHDGYDLMDKDDNLVRHYSEQKAQQKGEHRHDYDKRGFCACGEELPF